MWLDRFSAQSTPAPSPLPWTRGSPPASGRPSAHGTRDASLRRPELPLRVSSWTGLAPGSSGHVPQRRQDGPRVGLREVLSGPATNDAAPCKELDKLLTTGIPAEVVADDVPTHEQLRDDIDFGGSSLEAFARGDGIMADAGPYSTSAFEDLHESITACDDILISVEKNLSVFQADLAAVSAEIETLQARSADLSDRLRRRKDVEKKLGPEVDGLTLSPAAVRKLVEGNIDDVWVRALRELEAVSNALDDGEPGSGKSKALQDMRPLLDNLRDRAVERIRDHIVAQIKALRSPNINAQTLQRNALGRIKDAFAYVAVHQPKLEEEIAEAYINTMRWYYLSSFTRYKTALEKIPLHVIDKAENIAQDDSTRKAALSTAARQGSGPFDPFSLGRRIDILRTPNPQALTLFAAGENRALQSIEVPFRAFNLALVENASAEFLFMTDFFSKASFQTVSKRFRAVFDPALSLGQALTKRLVESNYDALGILTCVRLNQHLAFELQRKKVSPMEGYINGTGMILWPRFQVVMDMHCDALRKAAGGGLGKPLGSALSLTSSQSNSSVAPHAITQRFANFVRGVLMLSREAGDDEPVQRSLSRLGDEFQALLVKFSKSVADSKQRERFLANNHSLVGTLIADSEGRLADEIKDVFGRGKDTASG